MFAGLSSLRAGEKKAEAKEETEAQRKMREYLQKYKAGGGGDETKRKKKKKAKATGAAAGGIQLVDEDVSGFAAPTDRPGPSQFEGEEDDYAPVVVNPEGAERARRLIEKEKEHFKRGEDGSGWAVVGGAAAEGRKQQRHDSPDMSPPRKGKRQDRPDMSPPRRGGRRHDSPDEDMSPPRRGKRHDSPGGDMSPPRKGKRQDSPDMSPPRKGQRHDSPDMSPPRRGGRRQDSPDGGMSPPRRGGRHDSPDMSPPRRGKRHDSPEDMSPPRRGQRHDSPEDMSPPRRGGRKQDSPDMSPPRRGGRRHDSPGGDMSPPRRGQPQQVSRGAAKAPQLMSDGTVAGMISGRELKVELDQKKLSDRKRFKEMDSSMSGRNAETVYRDRSGNKYASRAEYEAAVAEEKAKRQAKHVSEAELEWGGGMKQKRKKVELRKAMEAEAARPFARGRDDDDLNAVQKEALRWGDPMAHLVAKRNRTALEDAAPSLVDSGNKRQMKKSGFIIPQEIPSHSWIRRGVGAPANRYSIKPGRHWDGVDRSNGFETKMWKEQQRRSAQNTEAFMWAQSDM